MIDEPSHGSIEDTEKVKGKNSHGGARLLGILRAGWKQQAYRI
jgi:hypothetical protein